MCVLILLCGMRTLSWYAELALRTRVSMSAIGSVIVMACSSQLACWPSSSRFPCGPLTFGSFGAPAAFRAKRETGWGVLPGRLGDTGQLAGVRHGADADAAEPERAEDRARTAAAVAPGVAAHRELRLLVGLLDQGLLGHYAFSLNGKPSARRSARPSSSWAAVVTTVMSMPRARSTLSTSISWNIDCSLRPNV